MASYDWMLMDSDGFLPVRLDKELRVLEFERGVLYRHGLFSQVLKPGNYRFWRRGYTFRKVDMRPQIRQVAGQEVLTADHAPLRLTLSANLRTVDPRRFVESSIDSASDAYVVLQLAARDVMQSLTAEEALTQRAQIGQRLMETLGQKLAAYGQEVEWFEIRDLAMAGDFKKAFASVITARQEGLAALERARGETAALRNLANAASLFRDHPELLTLRAIQALESGENRTLVLGGDSRVLGR